MIDWAVQATIVAAVAVAGNTVLRGRAASVREALLLVALAKFCIAPAWLPSGWLFSAVVVMRSNPDASSSQTSGQAISWIAFTYLIGVTVVIAAALVSARRFSRLLRSAQAAEGCIQVTAARLASDLRLRRPVAIQSCDSIGMPIAAGVFRRRIIVPGRLIRSLRPFELEAVLLHELIHHQRGHLALAWLRVAACAFWWWNPLVWIVSARLRHLHEEACDDAVVARGDISADRYCEVLLRAASLATPPAGAAAFAHAAHPLSHRIRRLLTARPVPFSAWRVSALITLLAVFALPGAAAPQATSTASADVALPSAAAAPVSVTASARGRETPHAVKSHAGTRQAPMSAEAIPLSAQSAPSLPAVSAPLSWLSERLPEVELGAPAAGADARESGVVRGSGPHAESRTESEAIGRETWKRHGLRDNVREKSRGFFRAFNPLNWFK